MDGKQDTARQIGEVLKAKDVSVEVLKKSKEWLRAATEREIRKVAHSSLGAYLSLCLAKRQLMTRDEYEASLAIDLGLDLDAPLRRKRRKANEIWARAGINPNETVSDVVGMLANVQPEHLTLEELHDRLTERGVSAGMAASWCKTYEGGDIIKAMKHCAGAGKFADCMSRHLAHCRAKTVKRSY